MKKRNTIKKCKEDKVLDAFIAVVLVIIGIVVAYPLWIVLISSISDPSAISNGQVWLLPKGINFEAYKLLFNTKEIWIGYRNSLIYTFITTILQMIVTTSAAFALSRKTLPGRKFLILFFLFIMYFNGGIIPTYFVIKNMHLVNTPLALIIPALVGPVNLILARNYFENSIPDGIYEAAKLDGAGMFDTFIKIAVPLAIPVLAVMVLNFALGSWNNYFNAMIYISDSKYQTLQVIIKNITTQATSSLDSGNGVINAEEIIENMRKTQLLKYATVVISSIPMIILYPFVQKHFIKGIMFGSVKE